MPAPTIMMSKEEFTAGILADDALPVEICEKSSCTRGAGRLLFAWNFRERYLELLSDPIIINEIIQAWEDSQADDKERRHEEGGYIVLKVDGVLGVERWSRGEQFRIEPAHLDADGRYNGHQVMATFHTHPNPPIDEAGQEWEQGPSGSDLRWHGRRKLSGIVVSAKLVYLIDVHAAVSIIGSHKKVLAK
jgi:hypothetical protein